MDYSAIQGHIDKLQRMISEDPTIQSLELTRDEKKLLANMPKEMRAIIAKEMSRYSTKDSMIDVREKLVVKSVARFLKHIPDIVEMLQTSYDNASSILGSK